MSGLSRLLRICGRAQVGFEGIVDFTSELHIRVSQRTPESSSSATLFVAAPTDSRYIWVAEAVNVCHHVLLRFVVLYVKSDVCWHVHITSSSNPCEAHQPPSSATFTTELGELPSRRRTTSPISPSPPTASIHHSHHAPTIASRLQTPLPTFPDKAGGYQYGHSGRSFVAQLRGDLSCESKTCLTFITQSSQKPDASASSGMTASIAVKHCFGVASSLQRHPRVSSSPGYIFCLDGCQGRSWVKSRTSQSSMQSGSLRNTLCLNLGLAPSWDLIRDSSYN